MDDDVFPPINGSSHVTKETINLKLNKITNKVLEISNDINVLIYKLDREAERKDPFGDKITNFIIVVVVSLIVINSIAAIFHYI